MLKIGVNPGRVEVSAVYLLVKMAMSVMSDGDEGVEMSLLDEFG